MPHDKEDPAQFLYDTVSRLHPLYADGKEDVPENVLSEYPDAAKVVEATSMLIDLLLPGRMTPGTIKMDEFTVFLLRRLTAAWRLLRPQVERAIPFRWYGQAAQMSGEVEHQDSHAEATRVVQRFMESFPKIREFVIDDIKAAYDGDPAALTYAEVQLSYPGLLAIAAHRLAHELYLLNVPVVPRIMSEWTHAQTGVDLHPGARVGRSFFIDHATGVVIGETTEIGDRVKIYQGVTLGAKSFPLDENGNPIKHVKRHPTVENDVIIYANATILGGDTVIGCGSVVGASVFLDESLPSNSIVYNVHPELKIKQNESGPCKEGDA